MKWTITLVGCMFVAGCSGKSAQSDESDSLPSGPALSETTNVGPLVATVSVVPKAPKLGDELLLTLRVEAEAGIDVTMPPQGEALGRFEVVARPRLEEKIENGKQVFIQSYLLQSTRTGKLRVPSLRVEFADNRQDATMSEIRELLTEELALEVAPFSEDTGLEMSSAAGSLDETPGTAPWVWWLIAAACFLAAVGVFFGLRTLRAASRRRAQVSAYDRAQQRLAALVAAGMPISERADEWYVEVSDVVRHYIEDATGVRAPELTTEEFLREAERSPQLDGDVRGGVSAFLQRCDKVKFAGYQPSTEESEQALEAARSLIDQQERALRNLADAQPGASSLADAPAQEEAA